MNLVLIGKFKQAQDAEKVDMVIDKLSAQASKDDNHGISSGDPEEQRFSDDMLSLLRGLNIHHLGPAEISQLIGEHHLSREGDRITVTTDEVDVSAFIKLFVEGGAKVEVFSAHDYPSDPDEVS